MKIWIAELSVRGNERDEYHLVFKYNISKKDDYKLHKEHYEFYRVDGWLVDRFPLEATVVASSGGTYKVVQAFQKELTDEELNYTQLKMRAMLIDALISEKNFWITNTNRKLDVAIRGEI